MAALPKKKRSKGRQGKHSAHFGMKDPSRSECSQCHSVKIPHRMCPTCGYYNDREVVTIERSSGE